MATLYILRYNNYINRILKRGLSLSEYDLVNNCVYIKENINYVPGDDITTKQNITGDDTNVYFGDGDYALYVDNNEILSRWFIIENIRKTYNSYDLTLKRDVLADFYDKIIDSPLFLKKGIIPPDNPFVFNSEPVLTNEIKQEEISLKDKTEMPWIVIYYARKSNDALTTLSATVQAETDFDIAIDSTFDDWEYAQYVNSPFVTEGNLSFSIDYFSSSDIYGSKKWYNHLTINNEIGTWSRTQKTSLELSDPYQVIDNPQLIVNQLQTVKDTIHQQSKAYLGWKSEQETNDLLFYNGKTIRFIKGSGYEYRKITFKSSIQTASTYITSGSLWNTIQNNTTLIGQSSNDQYHCSMKTTVYNVVATVLDVGEYKINVGSERYTTSDAPYDILAIPYGNNPILNGTTQIPNNASANMKIAMALAEKYTGSGTIYDVQLLPYCPIQSKIGQDGVLNVKNDTSLFTTIKKGSEDVGIAINCPMSSFSFTISQSIKLMNIKMQNQTQKCRIVSPNYSGQFEFNVAKAGGIEHFDVDCTYKPYSPYIAVSIHGGLYGGDFNDINKTMICGGDFSLPVVTDQFKTYEIQNKNYQAIFDRQIQNMDVNRKYQRIDQIAGSISGAASTGAGIAGIAGPAAGIAAGALSAGAGIADFAISEQLYGEQKRYKQDIFTLQLDNVKALPYSISKTSSFNSNHKYFPFVEIYDCTEEEKIAFANKIKYTGMTIGAVSKLSKQIEIINSYKWTYQSGKEVIEDLGFVSGEILRIDDLGSEYHIAEQIYIELEKGVYLR